MASGKRLTQLPTINQLLGTEFFYLVDEDGVSRQGDINILKDFVETPDDVLLSMNNLADVNDVLLARDNLGLGSLALQDATNVDINGGNIDSTAIGEFIPDEGTFTDLSVTTSLTIPAGSIPLNALASTIPNSMLDNSEINIIAGSGLAGGGTVALGGTITISLDTTNIDEIDGGDF